MAVAAVCYCRSSKDRADISIDVQLRELRDLAREKGFVIVAEFTDSVESGKDDDRPGLQALLAALYEKARSWSVVLTLDTSRIARRAAAAYWFEDRECRPRGVTVIYKNLPEMEDAERAIVKAVFHGVDEWHSLVSKRKGLAGMRENVRAGWRAGGRAPIGYQLEHVATGAVREGQAVTKSRLVPSPAAPAMQAYLRDRAAGIPRARALARHGLKLRQSAAIEVERNALAYAGHTVWNRMKEKGTHGPKMRPRAQWEVKRDTHQALITDAEAARILEQLERRRCKTTQTGVRDYMLAGLLTTPTGERWHGTDRDFYRNGKHRRVLARRVDATVLRQVHEDLAGDALVGLLLQHMRTRLLAMPDARRPAALRRQLEAQDRKIRRLADLAAGADVAVPLLRTMGEVEKERAAVAAELEAIERELEAQAGLQAIGEDQVRQALRDMAVDLTTGKSVPAIRDQLLQLLERVELDPADPAEVVLRYRIPAFGGAAGVLLASPQRTEQYPGAAIERRAKLAA